MDSLQIPSISASVMIKKTEMISFFSIFRHTKRSCCTNLIVLNFGSLQLNGSYQVLHMHDIMMSMQCFLTILMVLILNKRFYLYKSSTNLNLIFHLISYPLSIIYDCLMQKFEKVEEQIT